MLVKSILLIYVFFAGVVIFILWRQSTNNEAIRNAILLLGSLSPVIYFVLTLNKPIQKSEIIYRLFLNSETRYLETISPWFRFKCLPLFTGNELVTKTSNYDGNSISFFYNSGLDIVEKTIMYQLTTNMSNWWDISINSTDLEFGSGQSSVTPVSEKTKTTLINLNQIQKIFNYNVLLSTNGTLIYDSLAVPPNATLKSQKKDQSRKIIISNGEVEMEINIVPSLSGLVLSNDLGVFDNTKIQKHVYSTCLYKIAITTKISRFAPSTYQEKYLNWHSNVVNLLQAFDWQKIKIEFLKELEKESLLKATKQ